MSRYSEVIILCEDIQQEVFARTFLVECGIPGARIRTVPLPKAGAGESFVRRQFPQEVRAYRQRMNRMNVGLVVLIDADNKTVKDRFVELNQALKEAGLPIRQQDEKIGIFVPRRNIETWIYFLRGRVVDEKTRYSHFKHHEGDCKPLIRQLAENRCNPLPENTPPSMHTACQELPRILPEHV